MTNQEMLVHLQALTQLTQEEVTLLRVIAQEGRDSGEDLHDADRAADVLQERVPRMLKDAADPGAPDFRRKASLWGTQMGSIDRVVDAIYPSRHQATQVDLQRRIIHHALWLDSEES